MSAPVMRRLAFPCLFVMAALAAAPAHAGAYDKVFFVRAGGTAQAMWADRDACTKIAENVGLHRGGEAFSDPDYGMISAMGAALESDSMQSYGKEVRRAALEKCMEKHGWTQLDPDDGDEKAVRHANAKQPEALDAWIKANAPAPAPAPAETQTAAQAAPAPPGLPPPPSAIVPVSQTTPQ
jgi:hypothetical protein